MLVQSNRLGASLVETPSERRLAGMLGLIVDPFFVADAGGIVVECNEAAERVLKAGRRDVIGAPLCQRVPSITEAHLEQGGIVPLPGKGLARIARLSLPAVASSIW